MRRAEPKPLTRTPQVIKRTETFKVFAPHWIDEFGNYSDLLTEYKFRDKLDSKQMRVWNFNYLNILVISFLIGIMFFLCVCSNSPTSTDDSDNSNLPTMYDFEITYKRPSIACPEEQDCSGPILKISGRTERKLYWTEEIDEYTFVTEVNSLAVSRSEDKSHTIYAMDPKRWEEIIKLSSGQRWGIPHTLGDIFIFRNKQTGFEKQLFLIVDNDNPNIPSEYKAKMAQFRLLRDGIIIDE